KEPLSSRKLSQYANLADGTEARTLVARLNDRYDRGGRAFRVEQVAGGYQLVTRPKFAEWLRRLSHVPAGLSLSAPAMETLAVVAYRQPVTRADVEAIRGVSCGEILGQLLQRDLIRIAGRSEELGRPYLYQTTRRFMQLFGLRSLSELPRGRLGPSTDESQRVEQRGTPSRSSPQDVQPALPDSNQGQEDSTVKIATQSLTTLAPPASVRLHDDMEPVRLQDDDDEDFDDDDEFDDDEFEDEDFDEEDEDLDDDEELEDEEYDEEEYEDEEEEEEDVDEDEDLEDGGWEEGEDEEGDEEEEEDDYDDDDEDWDDEEDWEEDEDWE